MVKRKRDAENGVPETRQTEHGNIHAAELAPLKYRKQETPGGSIRSIQIITGSYERALHGVTVSIFSELRGSDPFISAKFADNFLFNAHASAIRCLALSSISETSSGVQNRNVLLASGGTDERVNVYSLSASPPVEHEKLPTPTLGGNKIAEDPRNRDLGSLLHHSSSITALHFPTRTKLLSAAEDNTIAITRTKDLSLISTIKAPRPKVPNKASGDAAALDTSPTGVNDFAIHSSMKLMLSVGKGERCMRLWNLVTAKKAGVLNYTRETLQSIQEGRYTFGEGRCVEWHPLENEFAVGFERGIIVFGEDSKPRCRALPQPITKLHRMQYLSLTSSQGEDVILLSVSTENGKILFYSTNNIIGPKTDTVPNSSLPDAVCVAQLDCNIDGRRGRVKDFEMIHLHSFSPAFVAITASSDGRIRLWDITTDDLLMRAKKRAQADKPFELGKLFATYETSSRITCMKAFAMVDSSPGDANLSDFGELTEDDDHIDSDLTGSES